MEILVYGSIDKLYKRALTEFTTLVNKNGSAVLGLATGRTPLPLYNLMAEDFSAGNTSYRAVTVFNLDEYVGLTENDTQSYRCFMKKNLFDKLDINLQNTFIPNGAAADLQEECRRYDALLKAHPVNLQLLGLGVNGHIGFNEPSVNLQGATHVVSLSESTIKANAALFDNASLVPKKAITMGIDGILSAGKILLIATGENKADALYGTLYGKDERICPSAVLQRHKNVLILCDKAAAQLLNGSDITVEG